MAIFRLTIKFQNNELLTIFASKKSIILESDFISSFRFNLTTLDKAEKTVPFVVVFFLMPNESFIIFVLFTNWSLLFIVLN